MVLPKLNEHADGDHPGNVGEFALVGGVCGDDDGCAAGVGLDPKLQVLCVCINQPLSGCAPRVTRLDHF